jgi:hypothetical protein
MKQTTFASVAWEKKGKVTRRERFHVGDASETSSPHSGHVT